MPYCPECGTRHDEDQRVCSSCGWSIPDEFYHADADIGEKMASSASDIEKEGDILPQGEKIMDTKDGKANIFNASSQEDLDKVKTGDWSLEYGDLPGNMTNGVVRAGGMDEVHLGKGLIKPTKVQMQLDGYHFSYEKPPQRFPKMETESVTKNRLSKIRPLEAEMPSNTDSEIRSEIEPVEVSGEASVEIAEEMESVTETVIPEEVVENPAVASIDERNEAEDCPASLLSSDNPADNGLENTSTATETTPLEEMTEPSVVVGEREQQPFEKKPERMLLSGRQTWYGVPLPNAYRISDRAVLVIDPDNGLRHIALEAISEVWLHQSFLMKLLGIGNVGIKLKKSSENVVVLKGLTKPHRVLKTLEELIPI